MRTLAVLAAGLALVAALPGPCACGAERAAAHSSEHACCAPPAGIRADDHGCCDDLATADGVLTPPPGPEAVTAASAAAGRLVSTREPRCTVRPPFVLTHAPPTAVLRL